MGTRLCRLHRPRRPTTVARPVLTDPLTSHQGSPAPLPIGTTPPDRTGPDESSLAVTRCGRAGRVGQNDALGLPRPGGQGRPVDQVVDVPPVEALARVGSGPPGARGGRDAGLHSLGVRPTPDPGPEWGSSTNVFPLGLLTSGASQFEERLVRLRAGDQGSGGSGGPGQVSEVLPLGLRGDPGPTQSRRVVGDS